MGLKELVTREVPLMIINYHLVVLFPHGVGTIRIFPPYPSISRHLSDSVLYMYIFPSIFLGKHVFSSTIHYITLKATL